LESELASGWIYGIYILIWDIPDWDTPCSPMLTTNRKDLLRLRLRQMRLDKGVRQADLAEALGRQQSYVAKFESGEKTLGFIEVLDICQALKCNPATLVRELMK
jgi:DNA-binding Xre family transcriptional regulator